MSDDNSDITIDYNNSVELYDEEPVNTVIELFIEQDYEDLKNNIQLTYDTKNYKELKRLVHTFKTTVRYMGSEGFAHLCEGIEKCVKTGEEDPVLLAEKFPFFMKKYDALYHLAKIEYNRIKGRTETSIPLLVINNDLNIIQHDNINNSTTSNNSNAASNNNSSNQLTLDQPTVLKQKNSTVSMNSSSIIIPSTLESSSRSQIGNNESNTLKIQIRINESNEKYGEKLFLLCGKMLLRNECHASSRHIETAFEKSEYRDLKRIIIILKVLSTYLCAHEFKSYCETNQVLLKANPLDLLNKKDEMITQTELFYSALNEHSDKIDEYAQKNQPPKKKKRLAIQRSTTITNLPGMRSRDSIKKLNAFTDIVKQVNNQTSELEKIEENYQTFTNMANKAKNNFFAIDRSLIKIKGGIIDGKKEKYDYQKAIMTLSELFVLALENKSQTMLIQGLYLLKEIATEYNFEALQACLTEWSNEIRSKANLSFFQIEYEDIESILRSMVREIKDILTQDIEKTQNVVNSRKYLDSPQSIGGVLIKNDEKMLSELKSIEMSEFFKMTLSREDIEKEIEKLNHLGSQNQKMLAKKILSKQKTINPLLDCNYPFKEENLSCCIF